MNSPEARIALVCYRAKMPLPRVGYDMKSELAKVADVLEYLETRVIQLEKILADNHIDDMEAE